MSVQLLYHDPAGPQGLSPFDQALVSIAEERELRLACPYISLAYLQGVLGTRKDWRLVSDVEEWLRSLGGMQRGRIITFLGSNRKQIRHYPRLHAKVAIGTKSAMLGSANFTDAGIRQRAEMSVLLSGKAQVEEMVQWFDGVWDHALAIDKKQLQLIRAFADSLPEEAVVEDMPTLGVSPALAKKPASLTPRPSHSAASSVTTGDEVYFNYGHEPGWREWEDARRYGFVCAGGSSWFSSQLNNLHVGDRVWVLAPGYGYVGVGRVTGSPLLAEDFSVSMPNGKTEKLNTLLGDPYANDRHGVEAKREYFVAVQWLDTRPITWAFWESGLFSNRVIVTRPDKLLWKPTLKRLKQEFPDCDG